MFHDEHGTGARHAIHNWEYADATERGAAVAADFEDADIRKIALQLDDDSYWQLTARSPSPVWKAVGNTTTGVTATGALTANYIVLGNGSTDTKAAAGLTTDGTSRIQLGVAGASVGGVEMRNATSGSVSIVPPTGALGTAVLTTPTGTDTLAGIAAAQSLTNKKLGSLTSNGLVTTSGGDGTLSVTVPGTGILTALGVNVGSAGAPVVNGGALGIPSSGTLTNCTGLPATTGLTGVVPIANLATGTPDGTKFVRDDGTLAVPAGGGGGTKTLCRWGALDGQPPASNFLTFNTRNSRALLDADDTTDESVLLYGIIPQGADLSSGIKRREFWKAKTATSGNLITTGAFERGNTDSDSDSFATGIDSAATAVSGTSGITVVIETNHSSSEIDGITVGDDFYLKITRKASSGSDTVSGDCQLVGVEIQQIA